MLTERHKEITEKIWEIANREEDEIFKAFRPYYQATPVGEDVDPQKLNQLHHQLLQPAIFTSQDITEFAAVWFKARRDPSGQDVAC